MNTDFTRVSGAVLRGFFGTPAQRERATALNPYHQNPYWPEKAWQNPRKCEARGA